MTDESRRMLKRFNRVRLFLDRSFHADEYARVLHVRLNADLAGDDAAFQPRILQLSRQHGVDFVRDFFAHALMTMIRGTHLRFLREASQIISTAWLIKMEPRIPSASSKTFWSTSFTCFSSLEIVTTPTTDLCQAS